MASDDTYMVRAIELAASVPFTSPNPRVGCVLVRAGRVLAEGVHLGPGRPHAEAAALAGTDARGATLYVNLEPCAHHGRTPPCAPAIAAAGVARVVAAIADPNPLVSGRGFELLERAGVEVTVGVGERAARLLNAPYLHHVTTGAAFVSLKLALTLDGRLAAADGSARWITGDEARAHVHRRRLEADAVMVGAGTVLADDPRLTCRLAGAARQPARVVVDGRGVVPPQAAVFDDDGAEVVVATSAAAPHEVTTAWKEAGAEVLVLPGHGGRVDLGELVRALGARGFLEVLCEGGARLASGLLAAGLAGRLELHHGAVLAGGGPALSLDVPTLAEAPRFELAELSRAGDDVIAVYLPAGAG